MCGAVIYSGITEAGSKWPGFAVREGCSHLVPMEGPSGSCETHAGIRINAPVAMGRHTVEASGKLVKTLHFCHRLLTLMPFQISMTFFLFVFLHENFKEKKVSVFKNNANVP